MKLIIPAASVFVALCLASCGGHSQANKEQINNAKQEAAEMLDRINSKGEEKPAADVEIKAEADTLSQSPEQQK